MADWTFKAGIENMRNPNTRLAVRLARRIVLAQELRDLAAQQNADFHMSDYEWYCVVEREERRV